MRLLPASDSCTLEGLPAALARLAARRFLARQAHAPRAHASLSPVVASFGLRGSGANTLRALHGDSAWRPACALASFPSRDVARHATRLFAARATDGRRAEAAADVSELTVLFERAAAHERVNGYSNVAGRQFPNFGAFLLHALERVGSAGCATGVHAAAWAQASEEATRYATLRVPERSVLVARCAQLFGVAHATPVPLEPLLPAAKPAPVSAVPARQPAPPTTPAQPLPQRPAVALGASAAAKAARQAATPAAAAAVQKPPTPSRPPTPLVAAGKQPPTATAATRAPLLLTFDVETTGLDEKQCRIIEIAVVACETGEAFSTLVKPGHSRVPKDITDLTRIDNKMVNEPHVPGFALAAERLELHIAALAEKRGGAPIVFAAHNAKFDVKFLCAEYKRIGRELPSAWLFFDTMILARSLLPQNKGRHKLVDLNAHFKLPQHAAHRAEGDAQMLRNVLGPSGFGSLAPDLHARLLDGAFAASAAASRRNAAASPRAVEPLVPEVLQSLLEEADLSDDLESDEE